MRKILRLLISTLAAVALAGATAVQADTPKGTFVMAKDISDIITLDPAEVFELSGGEIIANLYDRIVQFEPEDLTKLVGGVAEDWAVSGDGKTITFTIRKDVFFHSGNRVTAEDVEFSLRRVVKLNKTPAFIVTQFGWNKDNVDDLVQAVDERHVKVTIVEDFSPVLVLNALGAGIGAVVDKKVVLEHEKDGDLGYEWLKSNSAGSGPFMLKSWKANEVVTMERFDGYRIGVPAMKRVIVRHVAEPASQRLLLEKGDIDMARNLTPDQIKGIEGNPNIAIDNHPKGTVVYMAANQSHPILSDPNVRMALRWGVDYDGMANSFLAGQFVVHQSFWPSGLWGSYDQNNYRYRHFKAKQYIDISEHSKGFSVRIDTLTNAPFPEIAQSVQSTLSKIGIKSEIITHEGKTLWPMYRARKHELILARWSPDYVDPHSNADAFAHNPDNRMEAKLTGKLTWRNAWQDHAINALTEKARNELDLETREQLYHSLQRKMQDDGPFIIMFQQNEQVARRKNVQGFVSGSNFDLVYYRNVTK